MCAIFEITPEQQAELDKITFEELEQQALTQEKKEPSVLSTTEVKED